MLQNGEAPMGFVGSVQLQPDGDATPVTLRVTSADIKTTQEITYPEVIDGRIDTTLYQVGPKVTGGSVAFPLVHEGSTLSSDATCDNGSATLAGKLWEIAAKRNPSGRLINKCAAHVRYADNTAFTYPGCYVNTMTWTMTQSEAVNVTVELFGGADAQHPQGRIAYGGLANPSFLSPARVITWNDALVEVYKDSGVHVCAGYQLREFTVTLNNALERIYTLNGKLAVQDIAAKKREISGQLKTLGRIPDLADFARDNDKRYTSSSGIAFGYKLGGSTNPFWANAFWGVIFSMEEMALTTGIFEVTHNWRALGDCHRKFLATSLGSTSVALAGGLLPYPNPSDNGTQYGASTACGQSGIDAGNSGACFPDDLLPVPVTNGGDA